jgi:diketogulonate reductase-like aldo/keto reductase
MTQLWNALKKHQEKLTDEEFINMLKKEVHPSVANVYLEWNKSE